MFNRTPSEASTTPSTPRSPNKVDDEGYFGGDGNEPLNAKNYTDADFGQPMHKVQPAHRELSYNEHCEINKAEANHGYNASKARNAGSFHFG